MTASFRHVNSGLEETSERRRVRQNLSSVADGNAYLANTKEQKQLQRSPVSLTCSVRGSMIIMFLAPR